MYLVEINHTYWESLDFCLHFTTNYCHFFAKMSPCVAKMSGFGFVRSFLKFSNFLFTFLFSPLSCSNDLFKFLAGKIIYLKKSGREQPITHSLMTHSIFCHHRHYHQRQLRRRVWPPGDAEGPLPSGRQQRQWWCWWPPGDAEAEGVRQPLGADAARGWAAYP
jgi:hypothetical protein